MKPEKWIREGSDKAEKVEDGTDQAEHPVQPGTLTPPTSSRAEQICSQEMSRNYPYMKAWLDWKERYEKEGMEKTNRLEKQERLERRWNLMKLCKETIRENYDGWQERKITEIEKKELLNLKLEKEARMENQERKNKEFREGRKVLNKEEVFLRKIELAEMKENAWKWRGATSSHEEHSRRQEKGKKTLEKKKPWRKSERK